MKITNKYDREVYNQEAGVIKTRWIDNTLELNFADSFGSNDAVKSAQFKLIINVVKGYRGNKEVSKPLPRKREEIERLVRHVAKLDHECSGFYWQKRIWRLSQAT